MARFRTWYCRFQPEGEVSREEAALTALYDGGGRAEGPFGILSEYDVTHLGPALRHYVHKKTGRRMDASALPEHDYEVAMR